jgi:predicted dehydrogenase
MAEYHAKRFSGLDGMSISAVCDHLPQRARDFASSRGIPTHFVEPAEMCASGEIDAVSIASYDGAHAAPALAALGRGLPVFCEKPMARRLAEAEAMAAAAREAGAPAIVNFSKRNGGLLGAAAALAASGRLGGLRALELSYRQSWLLQDSWGDWRTTPRWKWRLLESQSTYGALGDLGSHLLDAALVLASARVVGGAGESAGPRLQALSCSARRFVPDPGEEEPLGSGGAFESFVARLCLGPIDIALDAGWRVPGSLDEFRAALRCEGGLVEVEPRRSRTSVLVTEAGGRSYEVEAEKGESTYERFAFLAGGMASPEPGSDPDFERGLAVQRAIDACARLAGADPE